MLRDCWIAHAEVIVDVRGGHPTICRQELYYRTPRRIGESIEQLLARYLAAFSLQRQIAKR